MTLWGLAMAGLLVSSQPSASDFMWHSYPGDQVQYGVPETDLRAAGFGCDGRGGLWISVAGPDQPLLVMQGRVYPGEFAERGDGTNVIVQLSADSAPIRAVLADRALVIGVGADARTLPGGGGSLMADMIQTCLRAR